MNAENEKVKSSEDFVRQREEVLAGVRKAVTQIQGDRHNGIVVRTDTGSGQYSVKIADTHFSIEAH